MRFRILLLLVLASLLGTPVLVHRYRATERCADIPDPATCAAVSPDPFWVFPAGAVSAVSLIFASILLAQAYQARRQEAVMLRSVGVPVTEEELPLEE